MVADRVRATNVHCHTNFIKMNQMIVEISYLTIIKMVALRYLGFLEILIFFEQLVSSGELISVIVQNFSKIGQTVLEISQ